MSHHFDTPTAQEDPRINLCDFYLFAGSPGTTVMMMTVNPDAALSAPDHFRDEGLYAIRFDLDDDGVEEVTFKVLFGPVTHGDSRSHEHFQDFEVRRAQGPLARLGAGGEVIARGRTGRIVEEGGPVRAFAGLAPDLFAGDAAALGAFRHALYEQNRFAPEVFTSGRNFFARRNVTAVVLEVPNAMIGEGRVRAWATVSLHGHTRELQVSRWGSPLLTHLFMPDPAMRERFNRSTPADDQTEFAQQVATVIERIATLDGSVADPAGHANHVVGLLFPTVLSFELSSRAAFTMSGFNGRPLEDDAMDVILSLLTGAPLGDGAAPPVERTRPDFPYLGAPYSAAEQEGVAPARPAPHPAGSPVGHGQ